MSYWISPKTSSKYPHGWRIRIPSLAFDESLNPLLSDQEIVTEDGKGVSYWEGAISNGSGDVKGYAELVGYGGGVPGL
jgi:predicted secreted hydrolase